MTSQRRQEIRREEGELGEGRGEAGKEKREGEEKRWVRRKRVDWTLWPARYLMVLTP